MNVRANQSANTSRPARAPPSSPPTRLSIIYMASFSFFLPPRDRAQTVRGDRRVPSPPRLGALTRADFGTGRHDLSSLGAASDRRTPGCVDGRDGKDHSPRPGHDPHPRSLTLLPRAIAPGITSMARKRGPVNTVNSAIPRNFPPCDRPGLAGRVSAFPRLRTPSKFPAAKRHQHCPRVKRKCLSAWGLSDNSAPAPLAWPTPW